MVCQLCGALLKSKRKRKNSRLSASKIDKCAAISNREQNNTHECASWEGWVIVVWNKGKCTGTVRADIFKTRHLKDKLTNQIWQVVIQLYSSGGLSLYALMWWWKRRWMYNCNFFYASYLKCNSLLFLWENIPGIYKACTLYFLSLYLNTSLKN